jgi:hypothetical protein
MRILRTEGVSGNIPGLISGTYLSLGNKEKKKAFQLG